MVVLVQAYQVMLTVIKQWGINLSCKRHTMHSGAGPEHLHGYYVAETFEDVYVRAHVAAADTNAALGLKTQTHETQLLVCLYGLLIKQRVKGEQILP